MDCRDLMSVNQDIATVCSVTCARKQLNMRKIREKELWQREKELKERALASAREYEQNKKAEEEALRRQKVERARQERERCSNRGQQEETRQQRVERARRERGKPQQATSAPYTPTTPRAAHVEMSTFTRAPSHRAAKRSPTAQAVEVQWTPPRLAERRIHPDYHPLTIPSPSPVPEANNQNKDHRTQGSQPQPPRMPFQSSTTRSGNSISRSNSRHPSPGQTGALDGPLTRIQAPRHQPQGRHQVQRPPTQSVQRRNPIVVSRAPGIPESYCANPAGSLVTRGPLSPSSSSSATSSPRQQRPPQQQPQPTQRPRPISSYLPSPPVPPKDPNWRPRHPNLVPPPLALVPRSPTKAPSAPPSRAPPQRKPLAARSGNNTHRSSAPAAHTQKTNIKSPGGNNNNNNNNRPNPPAAVVATAPTPKRLVKKSEISSPGARAAAARSGSNNNSRRKGRSASESTPERARAKAWLLKMLMGEGGSSGSVEWVSADAVRVERGSRV